MTQPTTPKRAELSLSMHLTGAAQLQSEGLTLSNKTWTVRGLKRFAANPALNLMHDLNVGRQDVMHFNHPTQPQQHVTHKAFTVSQICHLSQCCMKLFLTRDVCFSLQMCFFYMWKTGKDHCSSFEEEETSDTILNKLKRKKKEKTSLMVQQPYIFKFRL